MSLETDDAMSEVVPLDSPARHLPPVLEPDQQAHLDRVTHWQRDLLWLKYVRGQRQHGGRLWEKPGMLANAIDESTDLIVYLLTMREQLGHLADQLRTEGHTDAADRVARLLKP
jgi:hypothetical protein